MTPSDPKMGFGPEDVADLFGVPPWLVGGRRPGWWKRSLWRARNRGPKVRFEVVTFDRDLNCVTAHGSYRWRWLAEWMSRGRRRYPWPGTSVHIRRTQ